MDGKGTSKIEGWEAAEAARAAHLRLVDREAARAHEAKLRAARLGGEGTRTVEELERCLPAGETAVSVLRCVGADGLPSRGGEALLQECFLVLTRATGASGAGGESKLYLWAPPATEAHFEADELHRQRRYPGGREAATAALRVEAKRRTECVFEAFPRGALMHAHFEALVVSTVALESTRATPPPLGGMADAHEDESDGGDEIARLRELFRSTVDCCGAAAGPHCVARLPHCCGAACCGVRAVILPAPCTCAFAHAAIASPPAGSLASLVASATEGQGPLGSATALDAPVASNSLLGEERAPRPAAREADASGARRERSRQHHGALKAVCIQYASPAQVISPPCQPSPPLCSALSATRRTTRKGGA